jgi:hypothetical protein
MERMTNGSLRVKPGPRDCGPDSGENPAWRPWAVLTGSTTPSGESRRHALRGAFTEYRKTSLADGCEVLGAHAVLAARESVANRRRHGAVARLTVGYDRGTGSRVAQAELATSDDASFHRAARLTGANPSDRRALLRRDIATKCRPALEARRARVPCPTGVAARPVGRTLANQPARARGLHRARGPRAPRRCALHRRKVAIEPRVADVGAATTRRADASRDFRHACRHAHRVCRARCPVDARGRVTSLPDRHPRSANATVRLDDDPGVGSRDRLMTKPALALRRVAASRSVGLGARWNIALGDPIQIASSSFGSRGTPFDPGGRDAAARKRRGILAHDAETSSLPRELRVWRNGPPAFRAGRHVEVVIAGTHHVAVRGRAAARWRDCENREPGQGNSDRRFCA